MRIDLGGAELVVELVVKRQPPIPRLIWRFGPVRDKQPGQVVVAGKAPVYRTPPKEIAGVFQIKEQQEVDFGLTATDADGNPVPLPSNITAHYTGDNDAVAAVTDHGDGTGTFSPVGGQGNLGPVNILPTVTVDGQPVDVPAELVQVEAGDATIFNFAFGTPRDKAPAAPADGGEPAPAPDETPAP